MLSIEMVDTTNKAHVRRFIDVPFRLYQGHPQWVPPIRMDMGDTLNREKHPFYEHSTADFFIAVRDGQAVLSPSWSIHSGVGLKNYCFVWAMGGENQAFDDMQGFSVEQIR